MTTVSMRKNQVFWQTFEHAFQLMRTKVSKQTWLDSIYKVREKWDECYMQDIFTLGMRSTQLSESE
jgi:zinc finger SWIM domain-containing protein 3